MEETAELAFPLVHPENRMRSGLGFRVLPLVFSQLFKLLEGLGSGLLQQGEPLFGEVGVGWRERIREETKGPSQRHDASVPDIFHRLRRP